jgi:hypothetical protein
MPSSVMSTFTDPNAYSRAIRGSPADIVVTACGGFQADVTQIGLHHLWMERGQESLGRILHYGVSTKQCAIFFTPSMGHMKARCDETADLPDDSLTYLSGSMLHHRTRDAGRWASM